MTQRIVYTDIDGSVCVIVPSPKWTGAMEDLAAKDVPEGLEWRVTDIGSLPQDRTFRNAWTDVNPTDTVDVDMDKARGIHMDRIRVSRDKKIKEMDVVSMRAIDDGDAVAQTAAATQKQTLRDIPQTFDLTTATTTDALKVLIPVELAGTFHADNNLVQGD